MLKNVLFNALAASICAWLGVVLITWLDGKYGFVAEYLSGVVDYIHFYGFSAKRVLFWILAAFFLLTGWYRNVGSIVLSTVGIVVAICIGVLLVGAFVGIIYFFSTLV